MSSPGFYGDVSKTAKDLLSKGYVFDYKLTLKTKASNGVKFDLEGVMGSDRKITGKYSFASALGHGLKLEKLQLGTNGTLTGELLLEETPVSGLQAKVKVETGLASSGAADTGVVELKYKHQLAGVELAADVVNGTFEGSTLLGYDGFLFGGSAKVESNLDDASKGPALSSYSALLGYRTDSLTVALSTGDKADSINVALYQRLSADTEFALTSKVALAGGKSATQRATFEVGTKHKLDSTSHVRAKVDTKGVISALYEQQLNSYTTIATSAAIDATKLETDNHRFGVAITFAQ